MKPSMSSPAFDQHTVNLLAQNPLVQNLRDANSRLGSWLNSLAIGCPTFDHPSAHDLAAGEAGDPLIRTPAPLQIAGLLSELTRAGAWLRQLPVERTPELERELGVYRVNVERIRAILPAIHRALLAERGRLERERARVTAAAEWARSSRQTL
jgi:hypothetical protein